jgi:general secretion pathway protein B
MTNAPATASARPADAQPTQPATPTSAAPAATGTRVYALHELPNDVRSRLPQLAIGGSRYSPDPAKRFLIVNGQLLREQEKVTPDVTLEEIQLKAAVLRYGDYRYGITY